MGWVLGRTIWHSSAHSIFAWVSADGPARSCCRRHVASFLFFSLLLFHTSPSLSPCSAPFLQGPQPLICELVLTGAPFSPAGPGGPCGPGRPGKPMGPAEPAGPRSPGEPCVGKEEGRYYWNIGCYLYTGRKKSSSRKLQMHQLNK